jgi:hypothetical protein
VNSNRLPVRGLASRAAKRCVSEKMTLVIARRNFDAGAQVRPTRKVVDGVGHSFALNVAMEEVLPEPAVRLKDLLSVQTVMA